MKNLIKLFILVIFTTFVCTTTASIASQWGNPCPVTSVKASHILVDTKEQADLLKTKINNGESFEALAKKYSKCPSGENGGDLGYFERGQMVPEFEDAAFSLPVGKISEPIHTQFGWHIIKVLDKK
jgi:parvulin-like peptidyl-prolyl isomerase